MQLSKQQDWREAPVSRGLVAFVATTILCVGFTFQAIYAHNDLAIPVFLVALTVSNLATHRGLTLLIATIASAMLAMGHLSALLGVVQGASLLNLPVSLLTSFGAIWIATSILLWDPRRKSLTLEAFTHAFANAPTGMLLVSERGVIININSTLLKLLSLDGQNVVGNPVISLGGGVISEALDRGRKEFNQGKSWSTSFDLAAPEGKTLHLSLHCRQLTDSSGKPGHLVIQLLDLSESVSRERALLQTRNRFEKLYQHSNDLILFVDEHGRVRSANPQAMLIFEQTLDELVDAEVAALVASDEIFVLEETIARAVASPGKPQKLNQLRLNNPGDSIIEAQVISLAAGTGLAGVVITGREITEYLQSINRLRASEARFSRIFHASPDAILILRNNDGTIIDINDAFVKSSGYRKSELLNRPVTELDIFGDDGSRAAARNLLSREGSYTNLEVMFRTRSGSQIPSLVSATSIQLGNEACTLCIARDIRMQRLTEERLRESEIRFRGTFENAPIGILLADIDGQIFEANLFASELLDYRQDKLPGMRLAELVPGEDRVFLKETLERLIHGTETTSRSERRMIRQDGTEIWTNFHAVIQRGEDSDTAYVIVQIADITETKNSQKRMERLAFYDTLTGLANRTLFHERLLHAIEHARRRNASAALMYLDLDQFKRVNDTLGHEAGDQLLKEVSQRLQDCVRKEDTVGRSGGDEFTILLYDIASPSDAGLVAEKILQRLREPINLSAQPLVVTTSIGITIIPADGNAPNELMKNADLAMYRAKERGRNNYQFYSEEMNTNASSRLRMEYEIRTALINNEFELFYQPKVRLTDQRIVGMECLIRWDHPTRGLIGPNEFIQVAEETGAIVDIGNWIIRSACEAGRILSEINGTPIYTAVNISPRQFRDPNLVQTIQRALRQTKLNPNFLELEITETMLMHDIDVALVTLNRLAQLGLRFAIDDFGTGYSSLNYLKKFPINTVKVDRSFIMDIPEVQDDMEITAAVIAMAHRLKMEVVAEGVETAEQLHFLQGQACDYGQGYLFSRPVSFDNFKKLLAPNISVLRNA